MNFHQPGITTRCCKKGRAIADPSFYLKYPLVQANKIINIFFSNVDWLSKTKKAESSIPEEALNILIKE